MGRVVSQSYLRQYFMQVALHHYLTITMIFVCTCTGTILHGGDTRFWNMPSLEGVTISSPDNGFDFEGQLLIDQPGE